MRKQLPHLAGRKQWVYTAKSRNYTWSTVVIANSIKEARQLGLREARQVMGRCAIIRHDEVRELI